MADLPDTFKINSATPIDNYAYQFTETRSLKPAFRRLGGQRFDFAISSTEMEQKDIKSFMAFISKVNRENDSINVTMPIFSDSDASNKLTAESMVKGDAQVELSNVTGIEVGDFFNIAGHSKAYIVDGIVGNDITFSPNLIVDSVTVGSTVTFNGCVFKMLLQDRVQQFDVSADRNSAQLVLNLIEDIS